jgi:hypothetical protein
MLVRNFSAPATLCHILLSEFTVSQSLDDFFRFRIIPTTNNGCFLMCKAYMNSSNRVGSRGWHLTILSNGQLAGNGPRDVTSEWTFLAQNTTEQAPAAGAQQSQSRDPNVFPGLDAGREDLMKFFGTPNGIEFLNQPEYRASYELYQRNGLLSRILHR